MIKGWRVLTGTRFLVSWPFVVLSAYSSTWKQRKETNLKHTGRSVLVLQFCTKLKTKNVERSIVFKIVFFLCSCRLYFQRHHTSSACFKSGVASGSTATVCSDPLEGPPLVPPFPLWRPFALSGLSLLSLLGVAGAVGGGRAGIHGCMKPWAIALHIWHNNTVSLLKEKLVHPQSQGNIKIWFMPSYTWVSSILAFHTSRNRRGGRLCDLIIMINSGVAILLFMLVLILLIARNAL